jgi:hypothetical protein
MVDLTDPNVTRLLHPISAASDDMIPVDQYRSDRTPHRPRGQPVAYLVASPINLKRRPESVSVLGRTAPVNLPGFISVHEAV